MEYIFCLETEVWHVAEDYFECMKFKTYLEAYGYFITLVECLESSNF